MDAPDSPAAQVAGEHRLTQLHNWLDYLVSVGCNGLALAPIFTSMSHGYDTVDYFRIDPRLGTNEDFDALISAAHERGIKVVLDGVFNHTGKDFPAFAALPEKGPDSMEAGLFRLTWPEDWTPGVAPEYERFEGQDWLPALNHNSDDVADLITEVMCYWLGKGADGWRLDAAYAVDPQFWTRVLPRVRERFPEAYIVGEVIHGDYAGTVTASGMDSLTQYELWKATWSALETANFYELDWTLQRHTELLEQFIPWTFLGNHDTTRIASQLSDERMLPHAVVLLLTLPGLPAIYYGDEQGYRGIKEDRLGGDDQIRPAFPDTPAELSDLGAPMLHLYQELIALRRRLPWLYDAIPSTIHLDNRSYAICLRERGKSDEEAQRITVALSIEEEETWVPTEGRRTVLAKSHTGWVTPERDGVKLSPFGWAVLAA